jgi:hypothetical protein
MVDGALIESMSTPDDFRTAYISSVAISNSKERPLLFSKVELTGIDVVQQILVYTQRLTLFMSKMMIHI